MTGSSAVTRPLAGCWMRMPSGVCTWMYGSRFETDDDVIAAQFAAQRRAQRLLGPALLALVQGAVNPLEVAQQRAHVAFDRLQFRRRRPGRRPQDAFAMKQGAQSRHPPAPRQLRDHDGNQGDTDTQSQEEIEKVAARFLRAAGEEGQVMDQDHGGARAGLRRGGAHDHEQGAMRRDDGALPIREGRQVGALHFRWKRLRRDHGGVAPRAQADRVQPFVVGDAIEKAGESHRRRRLQQIAQGFAYRLRDERGTRLQIAQVPPCHPRVDERHRSPGESAERQQQREQEAQRKAHGRQWRRGRRPLM